MELDKQLYLKNASPLRPCVSSVMAYLRRLHQIFAHPMQSRNYAKQAKQNKKASKASLMWLQTACSLRWFN